MQKVLDEQIAAANAELNQNDGTENQPPAGEPPIVNTPPAPPTDPTATNTGTQNAEPTHPKEDPFDFEAEMARLLSEGYNPAAPEPVTPEHQYVAPEPQQIDRLAELEQRLVTQSSLSQIDYVLKSFSAQNQNIPEMKSIIPEVQKQCLELFKATKTIVNPQLIAENIIGKRILKSIMSGKTDTTRQSFAPNNQPAPIIPAANAQPAARKKELWEMTAAEAVAAGHNMAL